MSNYRKKLIEVNIPLQAINVESAKDASLTHGHPSTLHRYWARRPLAACRAVIFASMVDDPSECENEFPTDVVQAHSEGVPKGGTVSKNGAFCIACGSAVKLPYVREQGKAGNIREIMTAIVAESEHGKLFLSLLKHISKPPSLLNPSGDREENYLKKREASAFNSTGSQGGITFYGSADQCPKHL